MIKQVIVMRTDLNMRKGKMIAQGAHASMKVFFDRIDISFMAGFMKINGMTPIDRDFRPVLNNIDFTDNMIEWMNGSFTKIVVKCDSLDELLNLKKQADEVKIVNALIVDSGATEFKEECKECGGNGWKRWNDFENCAGHDSTSLVIDDTRYTCDKCEGTGKINKLTITCLAIGPDEAERINRITGHLKLL